MALPQSLEPISNAVHLSIDMQNLFAPGPCLLPCWSRGLGGGRLRPGVPRRRTDMTPIRFSPSSLKEGRWYEYVVRFALGVAATVFTGLVSSHYGASAGGLFLALPAISAPAPR